MIPRFYVGASGGAVGFKYDWNVTTAPQALLGNRSIAFTQGRLIGGGSAVNAMVYDRGRAADYQSWAEMGATGWDFSALLPYFKRVRNPPFERMTVCFPSNMGGNRPRLSHRLHKTMWLSLD